MNVNNQTTSENTGLVYRSSVTTLLPTKISMELDLMQIHHQIIASMGMNPFMDKPKNFPGNYFYNPTLVLNPFNPQDLVFEFFEGMEFDNEIIYMGGHELTQFVLDWFSDYVIKNFTNNVIEQYYMLIESLLGDGILNERIIQKENNQIEFIDYVDQQGNVLSIDADYVFDVSVVKYFALMLYYFIQNLYYRVQSTINIMFMSSDCNPIYRITEISFGGKTYVNGKNTSTKPKITNIINQYNYTMMNWNFLLELE